MISQALQRQTTLRRAGSSNYQTLGDLLFPLPLLFPAPPAPPLQKPCVVTQLTIGVPTHLAHLQN